VKRAKIMPTMLVTASDQKAIDGKIFHDRVRMLHQHLLTTSTPAFVLCATIIFFGMYGTENKIILVSWYASAVLVSIIRLGLMKWYESSPDRQLFHLKIFIIGTAVATLVWSTAGTLLMSSADILHQVLIIIIIAGITAGGSQTLQASRMAYTIFMLFAILPLAFWLLFQNEHVYHYLSLAIFGYLGFMLVICKNGYDMLVGSLQLRYEIEYQATHDILTSLPNRALLADRISHAIEKGRRYKTKFYVLFFDLDHFKLVNDSLSHPAGDQLLQAVVNRIKGVIRGEDTFARFAGDEFVIVIESAKKQEDIGKVLVKILKCFAKPFQTPDFEILITASIGISVFPADGDDPDELLRMADIAMYRAKDQGGNRFQFFTAELGKRAAERLGKETELRLAIANEEFFLCYQPQIDSVTKKMRSVEALLRWQHPAKGVILPLEFIPLAEETGLIAPLGEWALREVCKQNKRWQNQGYPKIRVAVNIAAHQIRHGELTKTIYNILQETGLEPKYLELELTENVIINDPNIISIVKELKKLGVYISLDDFGSGCSSLNFLRQIPIDRLKIDQSFIKNINTGSDDEVIIQAIISMAHNLNLDILAEGVETQQQLNFLQLHNCLCIQGFYFSQPLLAAEMEKVFKSAYLET